MCKLKIVLSDEDISQPSEKQMKLICDFIVRYDLELEVGIYETIHGHIALCYRKEGRFLEREKNSAARIERDDIEFIAVQQDNIRWLEFATDCIKIGL